MKPIQPSPGRAPRAAQPASTERRGGLPRAEHAIVVFGRPLSSDGKVGPSLRRRLEAALAELRRDPSAVVVVSGGAAHNRHSEAAGMRDWLVRHGVSPGRVVVEEQSSNTLENAENVAPLLEKMGTRKVTVVTEEFHVQRAAELLGHALEHRGVRASISAAPAPDKFDGPAALRRAVEERVQLGRDRARQLLLHLRSGGSHFG